MREHSHKQSTPPSWSAQTRHASTCTICAPDTIRPGDVNITAGGRMAEAACPRTCAWDIVHNLPEHFRARLDTPLLNRQHAWRGRERRLVCGERRRRPAPPRRRCGRRRRSVFRRWRCGGALVAARGRPRGARCNQLACHLQFRSLEVGLWLPGRSARQWRLACRTSFGRSSGRLECICVRRRSHSGLRCWDRWRSCLCIRRLAVLSYELRPWQVLVLQVSPAIVMTAACPCILVRFWGKSRTVSNAVHLVMNCKYHVVHVHCACGRRKWIWLCTPHQLSASSCRSPTVFVWTGAG
jgi:hypothetical protein